MAPFAQKVRALPQPHGIPSPTLQGGAGSWTARKAVPAVGGGVGGGEGLRSLPLPVLHPECLGGSVGGLGCLASPRRYCSVGLPTALVWGPVSVPLVQEAGARKGRGGQRADSL